MKIALVCPYNMFEHYGGVQSLVVHLRDELAAKGHQVKIITPRPTGYKGDVPEGILLLGTSTKFNPGMATTGTWTFVVDNSEVKELLGREKFDVINFHEPWAPTLARQILQYSKAAHVGTFHANLGDSMAAKSLVNMFKPYGKGIGEKMHILTAVSKAAAKVLLDKGKEEHLHLVENLKFIPNGIDLRLYRQYKKRQPLKGAGTKTIVYVGRLERRKGVDFLIRAFGELVKEMPEAHLVIAGEGGRKSKLQQIVQLGSIPNVEFVGYVDENEKRRLIGNADLFCSPATFGESFGIVLLEAMAMGTPLLAGRNMGYASVMTGYGRLSLVDPEATADFAERMGIFLTDESVRNLWKRWAAKEIRQYDYKRVVAQYEAAYKEAIATAKAQAKQAPAKEKRRLTKVGRRVLLRRSA